jgi:hypothetical protein
MNVLKVIIVLIVILCINNGFAEIDFYVSQTQGSDASGDGSMSSPWKTISHTVDQIYYETDTVRIHVAEGYYCETIFIDDSSTFKGVHFLGGYNGNVVPWVRDPGNHPTLLESHDLSRVIRIERYGDNKVDGFTIIYGSIYIWEGEISNNIAGTSFLRCTDARNNKVMGGYIYAEDIAEGNYVAFPSSVTNFLYYS